MLLTSTYSQVMYRYNIDMKAFYLYHFVSTMCMAIAMQNE